MKLKKYLLEFSEIAEDWFNEKQWLENNFQFYKSFFQEKKIDKYEWSDFQKLGDFIHAFNTNALAKKRALGNPNLSIERYREIFKYIITTTDEVNVVINNLLHDEKYRLKGFGSASISELIGYLHADKYVFYNSRDEWAIREIGIDFSKKRGEKFGDKFIRYNQAITNVIGQYIEIVGQKTNATVCLEVDQFFSWIYSTKQKGSSINNMIDSYKEKIKESKLEEEKYKWRLVKENNGVPNLATESIVEEINKLKFGNLAYQMALPVLKGMSEDSPEKLKEIFTYLFDESIDIDTRVEYYIKSCKKIYKGENQTHQDNRTAATLLTFLNPNNYTFYKSTTYEKYCKLINVKKEKRDKRYSHYLNLLKDLSDNYISKDKELLIMKESFLGKDLCNYDKNNMILAQDILNEFLVKSNEENQNKECNYWIFQGNPKVFNVVRYINEYFSHNWSVGSHKDKIKTGDKVILWVTGKNAGCYALAEITSELYQGTDLPEEVSYYTDFAKDKYDFDNTFGKTKGDKINIRITHNISENPITTDMIANNGDLAKLKVGHQGTNFSSNESEYNTILNMIENNKQKYWLYSPGEDACKWEEFKSKSIIGLGWDELGDLREFGSDKTAKSKIKKKLQQFDPDNGSKMNDGLANFEFVNIMDVGDIVIVKKGSDELLGYGEVISDYYYDQSRDEYKSVRDMKWINSGEWLVPEKMFDTKRFAQKTLTDITKYDEYPQKLISIINEENMNNKNFRQDFHKWLKSQFPNNSGSVNSYLKAIDVLSVRLSKNLFEVNDDKVLNSLYEDLIVNQKNENSIYFDIEAPSYGKKGFYSASVKKYMEFLKIKNLTASKKENNMPLNKILFGPPGTGKTYKLSNEYFEKYSSNRSMTPRIVLLENIIRERNYTWFDVIAAVVKLTGVSEVKKIAEHELILAKNNISNTKTVPQTIWGQLQSHTDLDCQTVKTAKRRDPMIMWKDEGSHWRFHNDLNEDFIEDSINLINEYKVIEDVKSNQKDERINRFEFVTFHQAFAYEDFIEGIKPVMNDDTDELRYEIEDGVFKRICNRAKNDPDNKYALFIDEINRGNIANIFGELITLIEPDKRKGMDNELSTILPYSKTSFSVPNNLDIIGTMNTADRSVEALDSALRRRFEFEEMSPKPELLKDIKCEGNIDLEQLLLIINKRIEKLLDKDNLIGHSYFMNSEGKLTLTQLKIIFKNKVIPLLQEYFYGDFAKIGLILGVNFVVKDNSENVFIKFDYEDIDVVEERVIYSFANVDDLTVDHFKSIY